MSDGTTGLHPLGYATPGTPGNVMHPMVQRDSSPETGSGTVNTGLINQLAYYAAAGTTVSGLTIVNSACSHHNIRWCTYLGCIHWN